MTAAALKESGFKVLKESAATLLSKYHGQYFGMWDMKIGVVQFGQGEIMAGGSIAGAKEIRAFTTDMAAVKIAVEGHGWLKGFTNMAQAFT